jgi:HEPN domain-containing protein
MRNPKLAEDYIRRAHVRLKVLDALYEAGSWADVVRESQELVELALKGLLRMAGIDAPRIHDVSQILLDNRELIPDRVRPHVEKLAEYSRCLRRDRELAFDGSEDLTPMDFYRETDARQARAMAQETIGVIIPLLGKQPS